MLKATATSIATALLVTPAPAQTLLKDLVPGRAGFQPGGFVRAGEKLYFTDPADGDGYKRQLYETDGTTAGTRRVFRGFLYHVDAKGRKLLFTQGDSLMQIGLTTGRVFYLAQLPGVAGEFVSVPGRTYVSAGVDLMRLDDGATTPVLVRRFSSGIFSRPPYQFRTVGSRVYFLASDGFNYASGLWVTDGTLAGTRLIHSGGSGAHRQSLDFRGLTVAGGDKLFYISGTLGAPRTLWVVDAAGHRFVANIGIPRAPLSDWNPLVAFRGGVVFTSRDAARGLEPWFSDGRNTRRLADAFPGPGSSNPDEFTAAGDTLFFVADNGTHGRELWRSNGRASGTARVADIRAGAMGSNPTSVTHAGSGARVLFTANDGIHGSEAWTSDGTATGTRLVRDATPGPKGTAPWGFTRVGKRFVLSGENVTTGREPYVLNLNATGGWLAEPYTEGCVGTAGEPQLAATGPARIGAAGFGLAVAHGPPRTGVTLFAGGYGRVPVGACVLRLDPVIPILRVFTDATGRGTFPLPIPNTAALAGADLRFQALLSDSRGGTGIGLSMTNGLHVMVGR